MADKRLLYPSMLSHAEIRELAAMVAGACIGKVGYVEIGVPYDLFRTGLDEHAMAVRAKVAGELEIVPHLCV